MAMMKQMNETLWQLEDELEEAIALNDIAAMTELQEQISTEQRNVQAFKDKLGAL